ncbi:MAG: STAS domain-containing protein [Gaiella sp.]
MTEPLAAVTCERHGGVAVVDVRGEIDISNAEVVKHALFAEIADAEVVVLDFSALAYADSAGVQLVMTVGRRLKESERDLLVVAPADSVAATLLQLAPIPGIAVAETRAEALSLAVAR